MAATRSGAQPKRKRPEVVQNGKSETRRGHTAKGNGKISASPLAIKAEPSNGAYYLMKSEPDSFSISDLENRKNQTEPWDGVRNHLAKKIMQGMRAGNKAFFYQSNCKEPGVIGIMEVVREAYPDHSAWEVGGKYYDPRSTPEEPRWFMVDCKLVRRLSRVIGLQELKQYKDGDLSGMALFKQSRLSVQPVKKEEWDFVLSLESKDPEGET
uniref:Thymocyte nuclear protein 1 n=1 Tax=Auxenochlorella protothecoides TaxID=3075 RepID=A0A1D2A1F2_AUXPR